MIKLQAINKTININNPKVHAVNNVSINIEDHTIFGIIGFSGAGKSTLVRCINLLEKPDSGQVIINDKNLLDLNKQELRKERKKIGMIFQNFNLMKTRTVASNIALALDTKLTKEEVNTKINTLLELVELKDKKEAYPSQLSGGQKQRVAIARALANNPNILLCDEATSALDPKTTQAILQLLKELNAKLGITIILITHEMNVVKEICNNVAIMEKGKVIEQGNILEVFTKPKTTVTKSFINSTTSINKIYELIEKEHKLVELKDNETIIKLNYNSSNANQSLIADINIKYKVISNIIYGNIEVISDIPIGCLILKLSGTTTAIQSSIKYLKDKEVNVEVIK
ncbi:MAG: ATP-binding cassette domain-containing protein [Erysipelotrichaceae bacterium]